MALHESRRTPSHRRSAQGDGYRRKPEPEPKRDERYEPQGSYAHCTSADAAVEFVRKRARRLQSRVLDRGGPRCETRSIF